MKTMIVVIALALGACAWIKTTVENSQAQSVSGPSDTGSPDPLCAVSAVDLGTAGDVTTLTPGGDAIALVLSVIGAQGLELPASCRDRLTPSVSVTAPCLLGGGGFASSVRAPEGSSGSCVATATVSGKSDSVAFVVLP